MLQIFKQKEECETMMFSTEVI